jgi:hypothetical protein
MRRVRPLLFVLPYLICAAGELFSQTQPWAGILDPTRAVNWSNAGSAHINDTRTQCTTSACASVSGGSVSSSSINAALASAPDNSYVQIPSGTFSMGAGINFANRSNVTLRGSGSNSTFLVWTSSAGGSGNCGGHDVCASSSDTNYAGGPSNSANWTGTGGSAGVYTRGATSIQLSSTNGLSVGDPLILDQLDDQGTDNGKFWIGCEYPGASTCSYSGTWPSGYQRGGGSASTIRGQQQIVTVTSISGSAVGIKPGIYGSNWRSSQAPGAWWASNPVQNDAVENMSLDHTNGGDGITFFNCQGCWVKGVRSIRQSSTGTGWGHVYFSICNHCTVRDSYFYGYEGDTYGISVEISSDSLVENNIFQYPSAYQFYNSDCEGCVAAYNYSAATLFGASLNWLGQPSDFHSIDLFSLSEGNIGAGHYGDSFHGTHALNTFFRNRMDGREENAGSATTSSTVAVRLNPGARYYNIIGNVLGTPGYHSVYKAAYNASNVSNAVIDCGSYPEAGSADPNSCPTSMFWGNWDSVNNGVRWNSSEVPSGIESYANPVPSSNTLPASFYLSSRPSWWPSNKAWPAIGPGVSGGNVGQCNGGTYDSNEATSSTQCGGGSLTAVAGGMVNSIPAMDCYLNTMGGNSAGTSGPLRFDAGKCYSSSGTTTQPPPPPPTNLTGNVQ